MYVRDIYGEDCNFLPVDLIAAAYGKANINSKSEDILKSHAFAIAASIATFTKLLVGL